MNEKTQGNTEALGTQRPEAFGFMKSGLNCLPSLYEGLHSIPKTPQKGGGGCPE